MRYVSRLSIHLCLTIFFICSFQNVIGKEGVEDARTDYEEARVRYIMADMSLGGPLSYYKRYLNKPNPAEAVRRWEKGVRVTNRDRFERHVEDGGPGIVYAGTRRVIDGMDVKLSTDRARTDYEEARVRYIMADMSLGGPLSYYKRYLNKPNPAEAVRRWENGVKVTNSNKFERHVEDGGPGIVYARTRKVIDGMDVKLSTD